jgi:hypothetical protein
VLPLSRKKFNPTENNPYTVDMVVAELGSYQITDFHYATERTLKFEA